MRSGRGRESSLERPRSELSRDLRGDLVLDGDVRPPARRVLRAQQAVERARRARRGWRRDRPRRRGRRRRRRGPSGRRCGPAAGRRLQRRGRIRRNFGLGRWRERVEHGQVRRQLVALGREVAAAQVVEPGEVRRPSSAVTISAPAIRSFLDRFRALGICSIEVRNDRSPSTVTRAPRTRRSVSPTPATPPSRSDDVAQSARSCIRPWRRRRCPSSCPSASSIGALVSSDTGNRVSPGVVRARSAAATRPPRSAPAARASARCRRC